MKIRKNQLKEIIKNILLEQDGDWLKDDDEDLYSWESDSTDKYQAILKSAITKEQLILSKKPLPRWMITQVQDALVNIKLGIDEVDTSSRAYVRHVSFDTEGNPHAEDVSGLKLEDKLKSDYLDSPLTNPIVIIVPVIFDKLQISVKNDVLQHEVRHIRNNFIKMYDPGLNVEEVRNVLRKDIKGKTLDELIQVFINEGRYDIELTALEQASIRKTIGKLQKYYEGALSEPPDELAVDELAVRIGFLQDDLNIIAIHAGKTFSDLEDEYGSDIAQIILFLDKNVTSEDVIKVVKNSKSRDKNQKGTFSMHT
jgi:hypothetical protein